MKEEGVGGVLQRLAQLQSSQCLIIYKWSFKVGTDIKHEVSGWQWFTSQVILVYVSSLDLHPCEGGGQLWLRLLVRWSHLVASVCISCGRDIHSKEINGWWCSLEMGGGVWKGVGVKPKEEKTRSRGCSEWGLSWQKTYCKGFVSVLERPPHCCAHCHSKLPLSDWEMLSVLAEGKRSLWSVGLW